MFDLIQPQTNIIDSASVPLLIAVVCDRLDFNGEEIGAVFLFIGCVVMTLVQFGA